MSLIDKKILLVHQHLHVMTERGPATHRYAIGMLRLISDHFSQVVQLAPVRERMPQDPPGDPDELHTYPDNVRFEVLYQRPLSVSRLRAALLHLGAVPRIARQVADADIVQVRLPSYPAIIASGFAYVLGKPMLVSIHGNLSEVLASAGSRWLPRRPLIALSDWYHRAVARKSVLTLVVGTRGLDMVDTRAEVFANHQFEDADLFERQDTCQTRPIRLLFVGGIGERKGTPYLLDAVRLVTDAGIDCQLTLVGEARNFDIQGAIRARGLEDRVTCAGFVAWGDALFQRYRESDIFVFPPVGGEGSSKVPMEALSQSLPVIATPVGTTDYIVDGETGLLVPPADAGALADAIARMIGDGELRRRCMQTGLERAREHTRGRMHARLQVLLEEAFADAVIDAEPAPGRG